MEIQPCIQKYFKSRKRPISAFKNDDKIKPSKVFVVDPSVKTTENVTEDKKVVYNSVFHLDCNNEKIRDNIEEKNIYSEDNNIKVENNNEKTISNPINLKTISNFVKRPSTPENIISVEAPTIQKGFTPSNKNIFPERPSTPETNVRVLEAIQKETLSGVNDLKRKMRMQKKLLSVKKSLDRISVHSSRLESIQKALLETNIEIPQYRDEPISPRKVPARQRLIFPAEKSVYSPTKQYVSPRKLLLDGPVSVPQSPVKQPAYKRFADLTSIQEKGTLILPYKYRMLSEIFRAVDTIVSMIHTRGENVTFEKLQSAVAAMIKKNLTHQHLGQIKTILPDSYTFQLAKSNRFTGLSSSGSSEKSELLIKPVIKSSNDSPLSSMNSALLLNRRRDFNKRLMDITKNCHEEFLLTLIPPVFLDKEKLTRWHPNFELEKVPDIEALHIPMPNKSVAITSAKQLLERAKSLLGCNKRLETAMESIQAKKSTLKRTETPNSDNAITTDATSEPSSQLIVEESSNEGSSAIYMAPALQKAIKGIPKGLLEKVRARQAAKALESMTQTPTEIKEAIMLSRLPEMARILRVLFVAEKRSILPVEMVIERVSHSFREHLSKGEIKTHLELMGKHVSEWLKFTNLRNTDFLKIAKDNDLNSVINKLETVAKNKDKAV